MIIQKLNWSISFGLVSISVNYLNIQEVQMFKGLEFGKFSDFQVGKRKGKQLTLGGWIVMIYFDFWSLTLHSYHSLKFQRYC